MLRSRLLPLCRTASIASKAPADSWLGLGPGGLAACAAISQHWLQGGLPPDAYGAPKQLTSFRSYQTLPCLTLASINPGKPACLASSACRVSVDCNSSSLRVALEQRRWFAARDPTAVRRLRAASARPRPRAQPAVSPDTSEKLHEWQELPPAENEGKEVVVPLERPASEVQVASVVGHQALIVTRPIEWGTVLLGYEQANRYTVLDETGAVVAQLAEDEGSLGRFIGRQMLRTRRPFTATVFSPDGTQVIFRLRRPFYFINSTIFIEDGQGEVVGEVHQRWHLWRRNYDLYMGRSQFAEISGGFLAWDFELKDGQGNTLALIDRNFSGFGKEIFTDAGKYVIHFGSKPEEAAQQLATTIHAQHPDKPAPPVTALARMTTEVQVIPTSRGNQLVVHRPLALSERMIALAAAISIDYDYFSRHSYGNGVLSPFIHPPIIPFPVPMGGGAAEEAAGAAAGEAAGTAGAAGAADAAGAAAGGPGDTSVASPEPPPYSGEEAPLERDLGGDDWRGDSWEGDQDDGGHDGGDGDGGAGLFDTLRDFFGE